MRIKSAVFSNLYSFGVGVNVGFPYKGDTVKTLIIGRNNDEAGADSNGSGKSNLLNSLFWIIFGEVFQEENADDIIRKGETWCSGEAVLIDETTETTLKIARGRGNGVKKFLKVWYNGEEKSCNTDTETQKVILNFLNIPASAKTSEYLNDFINTVYFSSDVVKGFMGKKTTSKERFAVVERFLGLKRYSLASERAKAKKKELLEKVEKNLSKINDCETFLTNNPIDTFRIQIETEKGKKVEAQAQLTETELTLAGQNERLMLEKAINTQKQAMESVKGSYTQALANLEKEHAQNLTAIQTNTTRITEYDLAKQVVEQQTADFNSVTAKKAAYVVKLSEISTQIVNVRTTISGLTAEIASITSQISNNHKCPSCGTALMFKDGVLAHVDADALSKQLAEKVSLQSESNKQLSALNLEKTAIEQASASLDTTLTNYKATAQSFKNMVAPESLVADNEFKTNRNTAIMVEHATLQTEAKTKYAALKTTLLEQETRFTELSATAVNVLELQQKQNSFKQEISRCDSSIGAAQTNIKNIEATQDLLVAEQAIAVGIKAQADVFGFWETGFNEIKLDLIDEFLPDFEDRVNDYLTRLKVNMRISFDTQKEKANASKKDKALGRAFKEEFNVEVCKEDNIPIPYGLLSKGQRGRLGTCVGMALRELTKERGHNTFDFFFLDEIADALDESGLRELVALLDETNGQKLVISHNNFLKDYFDDQIVVELTNEVSTIRQETL